jgi:hypothetical protein
MKGYHGILPAAAVWATVWILDGCSGPAKRAEGPAAAPADEGAKITQLYTTVPRLARGEKALVCYGVENARSVWLEPPRKELSAALSRCVEVSPEADTTYVLTAEGADGKSVTRELKIAVGAGRPKIGNVTVSALEVNSGDLVSICWEAANASVVTIAPLDYRRQGAAKGCTTDQQRRSTTYVITAAGSDGERDQEKVSVKVR